MSADLKIFFGTDGQKIYDSWSLRNQGLVSARKGYLLYPHTFAVEDDWPVTRLMKEGIIQVRIRGGWADFCVGCAIPYFVENGLLVICDLPYIRAWERKLNTTRRLEEELKSFIPKGYEHRVIFLRQKKIMLGDRY